MRRVRLAFQVLVLTLFASSAFAWEEAGISDVLEATKAGVVKLIISRQDGTVDSGSGFVATQDGHVISAAHLFPESPKVSLIVGRIARLRNDDNSQRENLTELTLIYKDKGLDIALLKFAKVVVGMRALPMRTRLPSAQETLYILGFPGGQNLMTQYPVVFQGFVTETKFEYQGIANKGNSGGPIVDRDGIVIGIASDSADKINNTPITNTYRGIPTRSLPIPSGFRIASTRPIFVSNNSRLFKSAPSTWTAEETEEAINDFTIKGKKPFCGISPPDKWLLRQSEEKGFLLLPEPSSKLGSADFRFEFIVRKKEPYVEQNELLESSTLLTHSRYGITPQEGQSVMLALVDTGIGGTQQRATPIILRIADGDIILSKYLPRIFDQYQFRPGNADSAFMFCKAKVGIPMEVYLPFCENLIKQSLTRYYDRDNPCLPGLSR
jgi:hypothetical protein